MPDQEPSQEPAAKDEVGSTDDTSKESQKGSEEKEEIRDPEKYYQSKLEAQERVHKKKLDELEGKHNEVLSKFEAVTSALGMGDKKDSNAEELQSQVAEANRKAEDVTVKMSLLSVSDIEPAALDDILRNLNRDALSIDSNNDSVDGLDAEIERLREKKPFLFKQSGQVDKKPSITRTGSEPTGEDTGSFVATDEEIAEAKAAGFTQPAMIEKFIKSNRKIKDMNKGSQ